MRENAKIKTILIYFSPAMPHIHSYIEKSLLIPPEVRKDLLEEETRTSLEEDLISFMETYAPIEKEILDQVNRELELLNAQIKTHIKNKEDELRAQEMHYLEQELFAYL